MTYNEFIEFNRNRPQGKYTQIHHIIPRCLGGTDDKDNLIELSWLMHYYAHYLLVKENPNNKKLLRSFKSKCTIDSWLHWCYSCTKEGWLKGKHLPEEYKNKISNTLKGRTLSDETKKKMSESRKGKNNPNFGKHPSEETRKKMSEARLGKPRGYYSPTNKGMHWKLVDGKRVYF